MSTVKGDAYGETTIQNFEESPKEMAGALRIMLQTKQLGKDAEVAVVTQNYLTPMEANQIA